MNKDEIKERKLYLIQTINAKDILFRYGVKILDNRCKCFFHGGKDYNAKVFRNGITCFVCNKSFDIFDIVRHFEYCDFWTAFQILGGTEEIDEKTKQKMEIERKKHEQMMLLEKKRKEKIRQICKKINLYQGLIIHTDPLSDEWCYCVNKIQYWMYLFEYFTEKDGVECGKKRYIWQASC